MLHFRQIAAPHLSQLQPLGLRPIVLQIARSLADRGEETSAEQSVHWAMVFSFGFCGWTDAACLVTHCKAVGAGCCRHALPPCWREP